MAEWLDEYDPEWIIDELLEDTGHGKPAMEVLRNAITEADRRQDIPYMFAFRIEFCRESTFYGDGLELMVMFPELLALADKYPEQAGNPRYVFRYEVEHVMWVYKWILDNCMDFYQVSMEDCRKFLEDYRERCIRMGLSLRNYYGTMYHFYWQIDRELSEEYFRKFEKSPRDGHSDCRACERNMEIKYYLDKSDLKKAELLSRDIENFRLTCGSREKMSACYAHTNIGRALRIYKDHWKEWLNLRCPMSSYDTDQNICLFFKELEKARKGNTVKIHYDSSFPLYREDGQYKIVDLFQFYYQRARDMAGKFDRRNGTEFYTNQLEESLQKST